MKSVIRQLYNGDLCLSERTATCFSEFCTARDIAVQTHDVFEDKLCQTMKQDMDTVNCSFREIIVVVY